MYQPSQSPPDFGKLGAVPFWQLVLNNPGLGRLEVRDTLPCDLICTFKRPLTRLHTSTGASFVRETLKNMTSLRILQVNWFYGTFLLWNADMLEQISTLIIPDYKIKDNKTRVNGDIIHCILLAFPGLQELSMSRYSHWSATHAMDPPEKSAIHANLETISVDN
ncbi:hypothetical protein BGX33_001207, partial [Mortierella sp. NVP41]